MFQGLEAFPPLRRYETLDTQLQDQHSSLQCKILCCKFEVTVRAEIYNATTAKELMNMRV